MKNLQCYHCLESVQEGSLVETNRQKTTWTCPECNASNTFQGIEGKKDDTGKLDWALLPLYPIREVVKVLMWGEKNYDRDNWQLVVDARLRYYNAAMRHITEWFGGKKNDSDTKLHHLAHAVCCLLFLIWLDKKGYKDADKKA